MSSDIKTLIENNDYFIKLNNLFASNFMDAYKLLKYKDKNKILRYVGVLYNKWYNSSLIGESVVTPANLVNLLAESVAKKNKSTTVVTNIKPVLVNNALTGFTFSVEVYNSKSHPIIDDLKIFLEHSRPDLNLDDSDYMRYEETITLLDKLSLYDPFYIIFLQLLCFKLDLVKKIPSIYSNKAQAVNDYENFFKGSKSSVLKKIVDAAIEVCAENLSTAIPFDDDVFSKELVHSILTTPIEPDFLFKRIYSSLGIDIFDLWEQYDSNVDLNEFDGAVLSSVYILGILIDQWFLTLFGSYLKLIQPLYSFVYKFTEEVHSIYENIQNAGSEDNISSLFWPCSYYSVTSFGNSFLKTDYTDYILEEFKGEFTVDEIFNSVFKEIGKQSLKAFIDDTFDLQMVYVLKAKLSKDKRYWKTIEVLESTTLNDLHTEISRAFDPNLFKSDYSFFLDTEKNKMLEYTAPTSKRKVKKADKHTLSQLHLLKKQTFLYKNLNYDMYNNLSVFNLDIELVDMKQPTTGLSYPRIIKQSKFMKEF